MSAQDDMLPVPRKRSKSVGATVQARYQIACAGGYIGMVDWPSDGGTLEEANRQIERLQGRAAPQVVVLGLIRDGDPGARNDADRDDCCARGGYITGQVQLQGDALYPVTLDADDWKKIVQIDKDRFVGFRMLSNPDKWVLTWEPGIYASIRNVLPKIPGAQEQLRTKP
jgi:hypothetical protein